MQKHDIEEKVGLFFVQFSARVEIKVTHVRLLTAVPHFTRKIVKWAFSHGESVERQIALIICYVRVPTRIFESVYKYTLSVCALQVLMHLRLSTIRKEPKRRIDSILPSRLIL